MGGGQPAAAARGAWQRDIAPVPARRSSHVSSQGDVALSEEDRIRLADVVEASLRVIKRHQFYLWDQGPVQSLLPHDILICGVASGAANGLAFHRFCITRYFRQEHFDAVCDPRDGLVPRLVELWRRNGEPIMIAPQYPNGGTADLVQMIDRNELRNIAAHGVRDAEGRITGYFVFSRVPCEFGPRLSYMMDLLLPTFQATFSRVLLAEHKPVGAVAPHRGRPITRREVEILTWIKEGKTNNDIAQILELSPWTVKNHMQAILKKLAVQNRSHAVARAMSMGILNSAE